jgi:nucleotide-binding universal stress UspA family protein
MFKSILVPTDGSELSGVAIANGVKLAKAIGARVVAVNVTPPYPYSALSEYIPETQEEYERRVAAPAGKTLEAVARAAAAAGVPCVAVRKSSEKPYEAIIEACTENDCDLIAMASHGRRGISGILLGSETQKVLVHSRVPVLVYR